MKKKRKTPISDEDASNVVDSNVDPTLLIRVSKDHRVNVDGIIDQALQSVVDEWGLVDSSPADLGLSQSSYVVPLNSENANVPSCADNVVVTDAHPTAEHVDCGVTMKTGYGGVVTPQPGVGLPVCGSGSLPIGGSGCLPTGSSDILTDVAGKGLVFKAGGSGLDVAGKSTVSSAMHLLPTGKVHLRAKQGLPRGPGAGPSFSRANPYPALHNQPEAVVPRSVPAIPHEGVKEMSMDSR